MDKHVELFNKVLLLINKLDNNVKLFNNGSVVLTGCKYYDDIIYIFNRIKKYICNDNKYIDLENIKINMINTNFNIGFNINREKLYKLLIKNFD